MRAKGSISIPPLQAVTFDLDDTLYPERDYVRSGYRAVGEHLRAALGTAEPYEEHLWRSFVEGRGARVFQELEESGRLPGNSGQLQFPAAGNCNCPDFPASIQAMLKVYREHRPTIQPFPWVRPLLERLRTRYRLGLLSDAFVIANTLKMEALGLGPLFDAVVWTQELGAEAQKPSQIGFLQLARELGLGKRAHRRPPIAYIGDNPAKDFVAPNELGWVTIQYTPPGAIHAGEPCAPNGKPQTIVKSAEELAQTLGLD